MSLVFKPNGALDVSTAATDLPEDGMQRCLNLSLDRRGRVDLRPGSTRFTMPLNHAASLLVEQAGVRYAFAGPEIYRNETAIASGLTDADQWTAIRYNAFNDDTQAIFALNGTDRKRIEGATVYEWGSAAPSAAPTVTTGAGSGLTGTYNARVTYARKSGSTVLYESNPSPVGASATTLSNESLSVTWVASSDTQITHARVYRTLAGGDIYYFDQDVAIGTVTLDTSTSDGELGGLLETDHDQPPLGSIVAGPFYNGVCFIALDNLLYWCKAKQPEYWPLLNFIEVGTKQQPIKAIVEHAGQVYCLSRDRIWYIQGTGSAFNPVPLRSLTGAPNLQAALSVEGQGIFHVGADGIYLFAGNRDRKITQQNFEPLFRDDCICNGLQPVQTVSDAWLLQFENRLYMHYGNGSVLVFNSDNQRPTSYKFDLAMSAPVFDDTNDRMLAVDAENYVRILEDRSTTTDNGGAIHWELESRDYTLQTRRHFPRWAKWDIDAAEATGAVGKVVLDDEVLQEHALSGDRVTRRRLIEEGNGRRCSMRLTGSGPVTIYAAEME